MARVLLGVPQIINGGRFFDKQGNRADTGRVYNASGARVLYEYDNTKY